MNKIYFILVYGETKREKTQNPFKNYKHGKHKNENSIIDSYVLGKLQI